MLPGNIRKQLPFALLLKVLRQCFVVQQFLIELGGMVLENVRESTQSVDMCWTLVAEEPHRSTILDLEHCPLKANVSCLIFPLHQGKMSSAQALEWPRLPLTRESRATKDHTILPQPPFSFPLYNRKSNARASRHSHL